jgi:hypothetical protein
MTIYGRITDRERMQFRTKFAEYYTFDASYNTWQSLIDIINSVKNREEFRHSFSWTDMCAMLREWFLELELTREDRGAEPHILEGYYGVERKPGW